MREHTFQPESAIQAARTGDPTAVAKLVEHYRPYLRLLAKTSVRANLKSKLDESDLVQEASLNVARDIPQFRGRTEPELTAWLRQVLLRVVTNAHRHYNRQRRDITLERQVQQSLDHSADGLARLAGNDSTPSHVAMRREHSVILARALERLPEDYNRVLVLRELEGRSLAEIAEEFGRSRNSVQKLWARAIQEMRRQLRDLP